MVETAVIIAGGEGSRLRPLTLDRPKTMVEVGGRPLLEWVIRRVKPCGVNHLVIGVAYKKEKIMEFMKANDNFGMKVDFSEHTVDGGTAQAFKLAISRFVKDDVFLAMNSDDLTNMNIQAMLDEHLANKPVVTMGLAPFRCDKSVVRYTPEMKIYNFEYGPKIPDVQISMGTYVFSKEILEHIPDTGSIEETAFRELAKKGRMRAHLLQPGEEWTSVDATKDIPIAEYHLRKWGHIK